MIKAFHRVRCDGWTCSLCAKFISDVQYISYIVIIVIIDIIFYIVIMICDRICEKGSYTRIRFFNFDEA